MGKNHDINILIVDDSKMMRTMIKKNCVMDGFSNIDTALNGKDALTMLQKKQYQLVTLDVAMPVMDGFEFLETLRQFEEFNDVLVMMVTAEADRELIIKLIELGANDYIVKPFSSQTFTKKVHYMLENRNRKKEEILADLDRDKETQEDLLSQVKDHLSSKSWEDETPGRAEFCPKCGTKAMADSNFCYKCGNPLTLKS
ncbi:MAG: response regulator [Desulfobacter sp.]|nr:MAG: response regulator [Desulfobacter sp.]